MGYYDKAGTPITADEFARLKWNNDGDVSDYARIGLDKITDTVEVLTVWLGLNHSFIRDYPPMIFETLIFGGLHDGDIQRYSTEAAALAGHLHAVNEMRAGRPPW